MVGSAREIHRHSMFARMTRRRNGAAECAERALDEIGAPGESQSPNGGFTHRAIAE